MALIQYEIDTSELCNDAAGGSSIEAEGGAVVAVAMLRTAAAHIEIQKIREIDWLY
jgi:hypothetical protein